MFSCLLLFIVLDNISTANACRAWLFMDGELGEATSFPLEIPLGEHRFDDLRRPHEVWKKGFGQLPGGVVGSAEVRGNPKECFLSFYERADRSYGWQTTVGVGLFSKCLLRSYGLPPAVPGAVSLVKSSLKPPDLGMAVQLPRSSARVIAAWIAKELEILEKDGSGKVARLVQQTTFPTFSGILFYFHVCFGEVTQPL